MKAVLVLLVLVLAPVRVHVALLSVTSSPPLAALVLAGAALCVQGLLHSVHSSVVLSRADTRNLTRAWMVGHVPASRR